MANGLGETESMSEPLTKRERNILAHLANDHSSEEIARLETLAHGSVKWYIHQIYAKLNVRSRKEAISRARELGLLASKPSGSLPSVPRNNLPRQLTSFIGRASEIATLGRLVSQFPLVTLTGSGGTGKTRLALQVGTHTVDSFVDGVWLVSLAPLDDPGLVPQVAASALGMQTIPRADAVQAISQFISAKHLLIVLDNCEHLINAAAELAYALLQACPRLHILATSREMLAVIGEKTVRCQPLSLPAQQVQPSLEDAAQSEAVRLFIERAQAVSTSFSLTEANATQIAQICSRLDGIPLAIELAAARLRVLSLEQIVTRLDNVFYLLTGGLRVALPRHQTLKSLIDWSYDLLSAQEQQMLCRLSVFAGSWTLEAAEAVCTCQACGAPILLDEVLGLLSGLADKSLVEVLPTADAPAAPPRYRMLEMIRHYGRSRLAESSGIELFHEVHLDYYRGLAARAESHLRAWDSRVWMERLEQELPNLRVALEWSLSGGSVVHGLSLASSLYWYWFYSPHNLEGLDWLNRLLAAEETGRVGRAEVGEALVERQWARGKALISSGFMGVLTHQPDSQAPQEATAIFEPLKERFPLENAYAQWNLGNKSLDEYMEMARAVRSSWLQGAVLMNQSSIAFWFGDLDRAWETAQNGLDIGEESGDLGLIGNFLWKQGSLALMQGRFSQAAQLYQRSGEMYRQSGDSGFCLVTLRFPAWLALAQGQYAEALRLSQTQMERSRDLNILWVYVDGLGLMAWTALTLGDEDKAVEWAVMALKLRGRVSEDLLAQARYVLARLSLRRGKLDEANGYLCDFVVHNFHNFPHVLLGVQLFAILAARRGQFERAAVLFGAQSFLADNLMNIIPPPEREAYHEILTAVRQALSVDEFAAAWDKGKAMDTLQAIEFAHPDAVITDTFIRRS
jgi:predicted ATPase/DNA-binding CsgD family transcriptional regulator